MKNRIVQYLVSTVWRLGSLWAGFLVAMLPLYIVRGAYHDTATKATLENIVTLLFLLVVSVIVMFFVYRSNDEAAKYDTKELIGMLIVPVIIHFVLCAVLCWSKVSYLLLSEGYAFARLVAPGASDITKQPAWSVLVAALVVTPVPSLGVYLGCLSARRKRKKGLAALHETKST